MLMNALETVGTIILNPLFYTDPRLNGGDPWVMVQPSITCQGNLFSRFLLILAVKTQTTAKGVILQ